jgi:hypothetical protein
MLRNQTRNNIHIRMVAGDKEARLIPRRSLAALNHRSTETEPAGIARYFLASFAKWG